MLILCSVQDDGGKESTDGNGQLVQPNDQPTDGFWGALGLVHGNKATNSAHWKNNVSLKNLRPISYLHTTNASNDTAHYESSPVNIKLETNTQTEDDTSRDETPFTSNLITERECEESPKECTSG
jgi:hypothetical protein